MLEPADAINIDSDYFVDLFKTVASNSYSQAQGKEDKNHSERIFYNQNSQAEMKNLILGKLNHQGFCIVNFPEDIAPDWLAEWQETFLGNLVIDKNPKNLPYSRVAVKKGSAYFADSCKAQSLHTDEGYTINIPHHVSLFCEQQAENGGVSTLVLIDQIFEEFGDKFFMNKSAFAKDAMLVESAHGKISKPLFFYYEENKIGIAYSSIVKAVKMSISLGDIFTSITEYIHHPKNQIRIKLEKGDLLILDNFRVLHGRTAFDEDSSRTFYRFWFSSKNITQDII